MSGITKVAWIWKDGEFIAWDDAKIHVLSHSVQFGASLFEGIRCYATPRGPAIFRLDDHLRRLLDSCRIYRTELPFSRQELAQACVETVRRNGLDACYIRPMVVRGYGAAGMVPHASPVEVYIACWPWGTYLGDGALENGVDVCVSSWHRPAPDTHPVLAKAAGNYLNSMLAKLEALENGYVEAIALGPDGLVSEGSGQNLFAVRNGVLITPTIDGTMLTGITRDSILTLARDEGIPVREQPVPREMLYTADELFFTGTAAEVTPIRSVDRIPVGDGRVGPITRTLQRRFLDVAGGRAPDRHGWLTPVPAEVAAGGA
ncbi:MAG TPA: branched-chain amino acid transaminase [Longimicrobiales bacterium]